MSKNENQKLINYIDTIGMIAGVFGPFSDREIKEATDLFKIGATPCDAARKIFCYS